MKFGRVLEKMSNSLPITFLFLFLSLPHLGVLLQRRHTLASIESPQTPAISISSCDQASNRCLDKAQFRHLSLGVTALKESYTPVSKHHRIPASTSLRYLRQDEASLAIVTPSAPTAPGDSPPSPPVPHLYRSPGTTISQRSQFDYPRQHHLQRYSGRPR